MIASKNDLPPAGVLVRLFSSDWTGEISYFGKWMPYKGCKGWWQGRFCDEHGDKIAGIKDVDRWEIKKI